MKCETNMSIAQSLFADLPADLPDEMFQTLLTTGSFRIERIISHGHASPEGFWYDQDTHESVLLVSEAARLRFEGEETIAMTPGSWYRRSLSDFATMTTIRNRKGQRHASKA
jgi:hypothetical protein